MTAMTRAEIKKFLTVPRHAILGTNRVDGPPQLSPIWYIYEDDRFYISIGTGTAKYRNLRRDPHISLCVDGCHPDARAVMIYGTAELLEHDHPLRDEMRWRIVRHYHETEEAARRYAEEIRDLPFVLVVVTPQKIISQDFN
jgi:PPOX class probable F420-dependent enzyme